MINSIKSLAIIKRSDKYSAATRIKIKCSTNQLNNNNIYIDSISAANAFLNIKLQMFEDAVKVCYSERPDASIHNRQPARSFLFLSCFLSSRLSRLYVRLPTCILATC